jgi:hypothetical protein
MQLNPQRNEDLKLALSILDSGKPLDNEFIRGVILSRLGYCDQKCGPGEAKARRWASELHAELDALRASA